MPGNPTLRDVARAAGVHPATVSRALLPRTRGLVNVDTASRIDEVVAKLGYRPNTVARGLRTQRSGVIGVLVPDLNNPLFPPMFRGIEERLAQEDYVALLANTDNDIEKEERGFEALVQRQVEGLITATAVTGDQAIPELVERGIPVVLVNRRLETYSVPAVVPDDEAGIQMAVGLLVELGHQRIGHIAGPRTLSSAHDRRRAYSVAMRARGFRIDRRLVGEARRMSFEEGHRVGRVLLEQPDAPTALVAANDLLALGVYAAASDLGLTIPHDLSVIGFNDMPLADRYQPPLSTVHVPHHEMGVRAASLLLRMLHGEFVPPVEEVLPVYLAERGSTAPPGTARPSRRRNASSGIRAVAAESA